MRQWKEDSLLLAVLGVSIAWNFKLQSSSERQYLICSKSQLPKRSNWCLSLVSSLLPERESAVTCYHWWEFKCPVRTSSLKLSSASAWDLPESRALEEGYAQVACLWYNLGEQGWKGEGGQAWGEGGLPWVQRGTSEGPMDSEPTDSWPLKGQESPRGR